jgi:hypothetical protein
MKSTSTIGKILTCLLILTPSNIAGTSVQAAENRPTIQLIDPTPSSIITPDASFKITFRVMGGWVSQYMKSNNPCSSALWYNDDSQPNLVTYIGAVDAAGTVKFMYDKEYGSRVQPFMFSISKVIDGGIECSYNAGSNIAWFDGSTASNYEADRSKIALNYGGIRMAVDAASFGPVKTISIGWAWYGENQTTFAKITAGDSAAPKFSFVGIKQGDVIEGPTQFTVLAEIGKALTPYSSTEQGARCGGLTLKNESTTTRTYESKCTLNPAPLRDETSILRIGFSINTSDGQIFKADEILVNAGEILKLGKPWLELWTEGQGEAPNSLVGSATSHTVTFNGRLKLNKYFTSTPIAGQKITICLKQSCSDVVTGINGEFQYKVENLGTSPTYVFSSTFKGLPLTSDNYNYGQKDDFSPISYSFTIPEKLAPKPELKLTFSTVHVKNPPKTVKWGKSFTVSIATKGTGGAMCEMSFQNPGWPSRKGIVQFRLKAGTTTNVTVRPWIRLFITYPLKYVCVPDGWPFINSDKSISIFDKRVGGSMGQVTIVP